MAIISSIPPEESSAVLSSGLSEILGDTEFMATMLGEANPERLSITEPHQVFSVGLEHIASGQLLSTAEAVSWRYLLISDDTAISEVEVGYADGGHQLKFLGMHSGPFAQATVEALNYAESLEYVRDADFEMRLLKAPSIYVMALWLHGEKDILIPLSEPYAALKKNSAYSEQEFIEILREVAANMPKEAIIYPEPILSSGEPIPPKTSSNIMNDIFVSFPFDARFDVVFAAIQEVAARRKLNAVRIDQISPIAQSIPDRIHHGIRDARLVIADITGNNPNVLNEIGQAQAFGKPLVLITQDQPENAPFNIRSLPIHHYGREDLSAIHAIVDQSLTETTSPNELLRSMLVPSTLGRPTRESWFVIAASPLSYRRSHGRHGGFKRLRRTFSDYVGVRGLLQSFGLLFGFDALPDNLDPEDFDDPVLTEPMNVYCIASPKTNRWTGVILTEFAKRWAPSLEFRADPASPDLRNVRVSVFSDDEMVRPAGWTLNDPYDRYRRDFGIIVRGPNPFHDDYMATVIAGRRALGTVAASAAFTEPRAIGEIRRRLSALDIDLENHKDPFWVVASMKRASGDRQEEADYSTLTIELVAQLRRIRR